MLNLVRQADDRSLGRRLEVPAEALGGGGSLHRLVVVVEVGLGVGGPLGGVVAVELVVDADPVEVRDGDAEGLGGEVRVGFGSGPGEGGLACDFGVADADEGVEVDELGHLRATEEYVLGEKRREEKRRN